MAFFDWKPELSVKIKEIDDQHKVLIDLINKLYGAIKNRQTDIVLGQILKDLADYTVKHFSYEEVYLEKNGYPEIPQHKIKHNTFVDKIKGYAKDHQAGKLFLSTEILDFLKDWLYSHIMKTDQEYSHYFSSKGLQLV